MSRLMRRTGACLGSIRTIGMASGRSSIVHLKSLTVYGILGSTNVGPVFRLTYHSEGHVTLRSSLLDTTVLNVSGVLYLANSRAGVNSRPRTGPMFSLSSMSLLRAIGLLRSNISLNKGRLINRPPGFSGNTIMSPYDSSISTRLTGVREGMTTNTRCFRARTMFRPRGFVGFVRGTGRFKGPMRINVVVPGSTKVTGFVGGGITNVRIPSRVLRRLGTSGRGAGTNVANIRVTTHVVGRYGPCYRNMRVVTLN